MQQKLICLTIALSVLANPALAQFGEPAEWPKAQPEWSASTFVRTSMRVRSIEESLKLYSDILGFEVFYTPAQRPLDYFGDWLGYDPAQLVKYATLRSPMEGGLNTSLGHIALAKILNPDGSQADLPAPDSEYGHIGQVWFMVSVDNTMEIYEKVKAAGYDVRVAPKVNPDGSHTPYMLMRGPDNEKIYVTEQLPRALLVQPKE